MDDLTRRAFPATLAAGLVAGASLAEEPKAPERDYPAPKFVPKRAKPQIGRTLAEDFVIFAHYDLDMVKKLLEREPALLNTSVDWGAGDWETALGGASHLGQHAIIEFLLSKGARLDIFAATALGMTDVVKSMITAFPNLIDAKGPHGFTIYSHARFGKERAAKTLEYLISVKPEPKKEEKKGMEKKQD